MVDPMYACLRVFAKAGCAAIAQLCHGTGNVYQHIRVGAKRLTPASVFGVCRFPANKMYQIKRLSALCVAQTGLFRNIVLPVMAKL